jgi:hypothetical protein
MFVKFVSIIYIYIYQDPGIYNAQSRNNLQVYATRESFKIHCKLLNRKIG